MSIPLLKVKYKICFTFSFEIVQTKSLFGIFNIDFCSRFRILLGKIIENFNCEREENFHNNKTQVEEHIFYLTHIRKFIILEIDCEWIDSHSLINNGNPMNSERIN